MAEPFSCPGLRFTKLERHFFGLIAPRLRASAGLHLFASRSRRSPSVAEFLLQRGLDEQTFRVRVHGLRPVCYQIETDGTLLTREFRQILLDVLGERHLRTRGGGLYHWVFQVYYPDAVVKALG